MVKIPKFTFEIKKIQTLTKILTRYIWKNKSNQTGAKTIGANKTGLILLQGQISVTHNRELTHY